MKRGVLIAFAVFLVVLLIALVLAILLAKRTRPFDDFIATSFESFASTPYTTPMKDFKTTTPMEDFETTTPFDGFNTTTLVTVPPGYSFEIPENSSFEIICSYKGHRVDTKHIRWIHPKGISIGEYGNPYTLSSYRFSSKLIFKNGTIEMNGNYTCEAGYHRKDIEIAFLKNPPYFEEGTRNITIIEKEGVSMFCMGLSRKKLSYAWLDEEFNPIVPTDQMSVNNAYDSSSLYIRTAEANNSGKYNCKATNINGASTSIFNLFVLKNEGPPKFVEWYQFYTITLDMEFRVYCEAAGEKPINYTWYDKNHLVISSASELRIKKFQESDSGVFTCTATNRVGNASKTYEIQAYTAKY